MQKLLLAFLFALIGARAEARVFNINKEKFAGYFSLAGGPSALAKSAYENEASATVTYNGSVQYNYAGEFGFLYSSPFVSFRFGFEILKPQLLKKVTANDGTNDLYDVKSDYTGYAPKLGLELNLHSTNTYRSYILAYAGSASVTVKNDYTFTSDGTTAYPGVSSSFEMKGGGTMYGGALGVESHMTDTTTYIFEIGYRQLTVSKLKYADDVTDFTGAKAAGDEVLDVNGDPRTLNFGGAYIALGFRFYL